MYTVKHPEPASISFVQHVSCRLDRYGRTWKKKLQNMYSVPYLLAECSSRRNGPVPALPGLTSTNGPSYMI